MSGNTQVNATEIRTMKFPNLETVARIGGRVRRLHETTPEAIDDVVPDEVGIERELMAGPGGFRR